MRRILTTLLATVLVSAPLIAGGATEVAPPAVKHPSFAPVQDEPGLPRVLLIGDSISMGYTLPVRALLRGVANVHRPAQNCGDTGRGLKHLDAWLGEGRWDVIHFNFGLHDVKYLDAEGRYVPPEQGHQVTPVERYAENLRLLVERMRKTGAKLVFATTTPIPDGTLGRVAHDEKRYNATAAQVMRELGVSINDLHAFVQPRQTELQLPTNVHFSDTGYEALGQVVAAQIRASLPTSPTNK